MGNKFWSKLASTIGAVKAAMGKEKAPAALHALNQPLINSLWTELQGGPGTYGDQPEPPTPFHALDNAMVHDLWNQIRQRKTRSATRINMRQAARAGFFRTARPLGWGLYRVEELDGGLGSIWYVEKDAHGTSFLVKQTDPTGEIVRQMKTASLKKASADSADSADSAVCPECKQTISIVNERFVTHGNNRGSERETTKNHPCLGSGRRADGQYIPPGKTAMAIKCAAGDDGIDFKSTRLPKGEKQSCELCGNPATWRIDASRGEEHETSYFCDYDHKACFAKSGEIPCARCNTMLPVEHYQGHGGYCVECERSKQASKSAKIASYGDNDEHPQQTAEPMEGQPTPGGLANEMTAADIAKRHGVGEQEIAEQLQMGISVEFEHTNDETVSKDIALDHLFEDPEYYTKLQTIHKESSLKKSAMGDGAYMFQAALLCEKCGEDVKTQLDSEGKTPANPQDEASFDSGDYPKGPYPEGGGEADSPQHCDTCGVFLRNPLTTDGMDYVRQKLAEFQGHRLGNEKVLREWAEFYGEDFLSDPDASVEIREGCVQGLTRIAMDDISDPMVLLYLGTALWAETDNADESGGQPLDKNYDITNIAPDSIQKAIADCQSFKQRAGDLLEGLDMESVGHDFWLTRNGHGAGFWDGDYEESVGDALTKLSKEFGECSIVVGDDGLLHIEGGR